MHSSWNYRLVAAGLVLFAACGDSGETTTTATTSTTTTTTPGTGEPSTGAPTTGVDATSSSSGGASGSSSTGPAATTSTGPTGTDTGETTVSTSETSSGETSTGETGGFFIPCTVDDDCILIDDCCSCEPIGPGEEIPACDLPECFATQCTAVGLNQVQVQCLFGRCTFEKVPCNPVYVTCDEAAPPCPDGTVASIDGDNGCWTGNCVPAEACDWVPDCSYCQDDESICVGKLQKGAYTVCEPKPADCGDVDDIDCGCGQQVCDGLPPHTICIDAADDIQCECPQC